MEVEFFMDNQKLEERLNQLKLQFEQYTLQEQQIVTTYNTKIEELRAEGEKQLQTIQSAKEQVRGAYTEIMYILHPELLPKEDKSDENSVVVKSESVVDTVGTEETTEDENIEEKDSVQLSEEELQKIAQSMNTVSTEKTTKTNNIKPNKNNKIKQEDIPDYLKEEYNK